MIDSALKDKIAAQLASMARSAGALLMEHYGQLKARDISFKGRRNLLTRADQESEALILQQIREAFPDHEILAEESGQSLGFSEGGSDFKWIVDPLDGTTNFVHQIPMFTVSLGLLFEGRPFAGCVFCSLSRRVFPYR